MGTFFTKTMRSLIFGMLLLVSGQIFAGAPTWSRVDYTNSTTFVGIVKIIQFTPAFGYTPVAGDYIGAFVGTECRMVAQIFANGTDLYVSSVIQGGDNCAPNEPNCTAGGSETVTFRLWSNTASKEYPNIKGDTLSYPGSNIGSTTPYEIGRPKTAKDLLTLSVTGVTLTPAFSTSTTSYTATVSTIPALTDYVYTSSPKSTVSIVNATSLTGTTAAATATITVTAEDGSTKKYTIVYSSACTLSSTLPTITPTSTSICKGKSTSLTAAGAGTSFTWYANATSTTALATTATYSVTPTATTTLYVSQSTSTVCVSPRASVTVTVNAAPSITATTSSNSICIGSTATISVSGGTSYSWDNNVGSVTSKAVTPTTSTTYNVTGTDANTCTNTASVTVTVNALPTIIASVSPTAICSGATATLSASGGVSYSWNNGIGSATTKAINPTVTTSYIVTGTNANGCSNTASVSLKVNALPTIYATAVPSIICTGSTATLAVTGATAYSWNNNIGTSVTKAISPTATTNYAVTGTDANGCINTATTIVTVNALPTITASANPAAICIGNSSTISALGATTLTWSNGIGVATSKSVTPPTTTTYLVTGIDANGCTNTGSTLVTVNGLPTITVTATPTAICSGSSSTLKATGAISFIWDNGLQAGTTQTVSPLVNTIYNVTGTDANGCTASNKIEVAVTTPTLATALDVTVPINTTPIPSLTATGTLVKWYDETGATLLFTGNTFTPNITSPIVATSFKYKVTNTVNTCESASSSVTLAFVSCTVAAPSVDKTSQSVCKGTAFTAFTATVTGTSVQWYNATSPTPIATTAAFTPQASGDYYVSQTNVCEGAKTKVTATIDSLPAVVISANPTSICSGKSTSLTASGASTYAWDNNLTSGSTQTVSPVATTIYNVTGTDAKGCKASNKIEITVTTPTIPTASNVTVPVNTTPIPTLLAAGTLVKWYDATSGNYLVTGGTFTPSIQSPATPTYFTYNVTNTVNGCESATKQVILAFTSCTVTAPNVDKTAQSVCSGTGFTAFTATSGTSIKWYNAASLTPISTTAAFTPQAAGDYYVTQTDVCEGAKTKVTATIYALPTVALVSNNSAICAGTSATLTASGATSYVWDNNLTAGSSNVVSPKVNTTYSITGTDANKCVATSVVDITVTTPALPTVSDVTVSVNTNPIPELSADGTLVKWYDASGKYLFTGLKYTPSVVSSKDTTYKFTVTNTENSCESTAKTLSLTFSACSVGAPTVDKPSQAVCQGTAFTAFNVTSASTSIKWYNATSATPIATTASFIPQLAGDYYVTQTNVCEGAKTKVTATINALPTITIPSIAKLCANDKAVTVNATPQGGSFSGTGINPNGVFTPTTSGSYSISYTYSDINTKCSNSATTTIVVNAIPTVVASADKLEICNGLSTTISAKGADSYVWDNTIGQIVSTIVSPTANTTYSVTGTDANGCKNTSSVSIVVNATPATPNATGDTQCDGSIGTLTSTGTTGTINWYNASGSSIIGNTPIISVSTAGKYSVSQTINGCESAKKVVEFIVNAKPNAITISNVTINSGDAISAISAGQIINWYDETKTNKLATSDSYTPSVSNTVLKAYTYYVDVTSTAGCKSAMTSFIFEVKNSNCPSAPEVTVTPLCEGDKGTLTASGNNIKWYDVATGGTAISTLNSMNVTAAGKYYASQSNGSCESQRAMVDVVVNPKTVVTIDAPLTMKSTDAAVVITVSPIGGILSGDGILLTKFYPNLGKSGDNIITYSFANTNGCTTTMNKTITVNDGTVDLSKLITAINSGSDKTQSAYTNGLIGSTVGKYPQSAVNALNTVINNAIAIKNNPTSTQTTIDNTTKAVNDAIAIFNNSIIKAGDKTTLDSLIAVATTKVNTSTYGTTIGTYPTASKTALTDAINVAKSVSLDKTATEETVNAAEIALQQAITDFNNSLIKTIPVTGITISTPIVSIKIGETKQLTFTYEPADATSPEFIWTSNKPSVVKVDANGKITSISEGSATITVALKSDPTIYKYILVTSTKVGIDDIENNSPKLYPNLTSSIVNIKNAKDVKLVKVISTNKETVKNFNCESDFIMMDIEDLATGSYYFIIELRDGSVITEQVIKQ